MKRERGFTLIEMLVVLGIMALTLGLAMPMLAAGTTTTDAQSTADQIAAALRATRAAAMTQGRAADFTIDVARGVTRSGGRVERLATAGDTRLSLYTTDGAVGSASSGAIRFYPDGGSTGGGVTVETGTRVYVVAVDWLAGAVSVEQKQHDGTY